MGDRAPERGAGGIRSRDGHSIAALLTALAVVGIATAIVYGGLGTASGRHALVADARRVHASLAEARARAIAEERAYRVEAPGGRSLRVSRLEGGTWRVVGRPVRLPTYLRIRISGGPLASVEFRPPGRVSHPRTVVIEGPTDRRTIHVLASGMIRWSDR
ncbi:MAG: GspH/FimT family pseudopilin [Gemmatimonadota bacterium]